MMSIGFGQVLILLVIILILFGAGKLPQVMKDLSKGMKAFKQGLEGEDENNEPEATKVVSKKDVKLQTKKRPTTSKKAG